MSDQTTVLSSHKWVDTQKKVTVSRKTRRSSAILHMHDYFEIELILDGQGLQNLNGEMYELKKGTVYFLSPIDFHSVVPQNQLELVNISFDTNVISPQLINALVNRNKNIIFELKPEEIQRMELIVDLFSNDLQTNDKYTKMNIKNLLEWLLILLLRHTDHKLEPEESNTDILPIYKCMRHLFLHFTETPSLEDMARISGYSTNYFSKQFHEITGKKYIDFLTSLKLNRAKLLLTATKRSVIDISESCGFTSLSNFNRTFKIETGVSPTQYRSQNTHI